MPAQALAALNEAVDRLTADFGTWKTPWGQINWFQRVNDEIVQQFPDDRRPFDPGAVHLGPVGFAGLAWAKRYPDTRKYYGTSGNSFVAVVEFGDRVHARAVTAGGESGDPALKHFDDQAKRYASGDLREVYFYPDQLARPRRAQASPGRIAVTCEVMEALPWRGREFHDRIAEKPSATTCASACSAPPPQPAGPRLRRRDLHPPPELLHRPRQAQPRHGHPFAWPSSFETCRCASATRRSAAAGFAPVFVERPLDDQLAGAAGHRPDPGRPRPPTRPWSSTCAGTWWPPTRPWRRWIAGVAPAAGPRR